MTDWAAEVGQKTDWAAELKGPPPAAPIGMAETAVRKFGQGSAFGFTDELSGVTSAVIDKVGFGDLYKNQSFVDRYKANRDRRRAELKQMEADNPATSAAAEFGGSIASGLGGGGAAVAKVAAKPLLRTVAAEGAKLGAKYGAAGGLGYSEADTPLGVAEDTAIGAGAGALAGAAVPTVAAGTGKLIRATANKSEAFTGALKTLTDNGVTAFTKGQARGSDVTKMVETTLAQAPVVGGSIAKTLKQGRQQYQQALLKMVGLDDGTNLINSKTIRRLKSMFNDQYGAALKTKGVALHENEFLDKPAEFETKYVDEIPDVNKANAVRVQIGRLLNDAVTSSKNGQIAGEAYQMMRSKLGRIASRTTDNDIKQPIRALQEMLDDTFANTNGGAVAEVNGRYSLFKDLETVVRKSKEANQAEGYIVPSKLAAQAAKKTGNQKWLDLTESAAIVLPDRIPNSATAQRRLALEVLGLAGGGAAGYLSGAASAVPYAAATAGAAYGLSKGKLPGPVRAPLASFAVPALTGPIIAK